MRKVFMAVVAAVVGLAVMVLLVVAVQQTRVAADRERCSDRLERFGLALHNWHDTFGSFPPTSRDEHSWRVHIYPFVEGSAYYDSYHFDEPWNSEWNRTLEFRRLPEKMIAEERDETGHLMVIPGVSSLASEVWQCTLEEDAKSTHTNFLMLVGPGAFGLPDRGRSFDEITDGLSSTIIVAEYAGHDIHWLEPNDFDTETMSFRINDPDKPSIPSHHPGGALVGMADGSVRWLSNDLPPEVVKAMCTINGGEKIIEDENAPGGFRLEQ